MLLDRLIFFAILPLLWVLESAPRRVRGAVIAALIYPLFAVVPRFRNVAQRNLSLVFPNRDEGWYRKMISDSVLSIARLINDAFELKRVDAAWIKDRVVVNYSSQIKSFLDSGERPAIYLSGHLGSFDLMVQAHCLHGYPCDMVVRPFANPDMENWFKRYREKNGCRVIARHGAFRQVLKSLKSGRSVGMLFDQNVKKNHAVFIPWFGKPAATTRSVALAVLETNAMVVMCCLYFKDDDTYSLEAELIDLSHVCNDNVLSLDEKVYAITKELSDRFQAYILKAPEQWFWCHRRWKTRPVGEDENFY